MEEKIVKTPDGLFIVIGDHKVRIVSDLPDDVLAQYGEGLIKKAKRRLKKRVKKTKKMLRKSTKPKKPKKLTKEEIELSKKNAPAPAASGASLASFYQRPPFNNGDTFNSSTTVDKDKIKKDLIESGKYIEAPGIGKMLLISPDGKSAEVSKEELDKLKDLTLNLNIMTEKYNKMVEDSAIINAENDELKTEKERLSDLKDQYEKELEDFDFNANKKTKEFEDLEEKLKIAEENYGNVDAEIKNKTEQLFFLSKEIRELRNEIDRVTNEKDKLNKESSLMYNGLIKREAETVVKVLQKDDLAKILELFGRSYDEMMKLNKPELIKQVFEEKSFMENLAMAIDQNIKDVHEGKTYKVKKIIELPLQKGEKRKKNKEIIEDVEYKKFDLSQINEVRNIVEKAKDLIKEEREAYNGDLHPETVNPEHREAIELFNKKSKEKLEKELDIEEFHIRKNEYEEEIDEYNKQIDEYIEKNKEYKKQKKKNKEAEKRGEEVIELVKPVLPIEPKKPFLLEQIKFDSNERGNRIRKSLKDSEDISDFLDFSEPKQKGPLLLLPPGEIVKEEEENPPDEPVIAEFIEEIDEDVKKQEGAGLNDNTGLWNYEMEKLMKKYKNKGFKGVYSLDMVNEIPVNKSEPEISFIMNTQPQSVKFGHWVGVYMNHDNLEYYDSFGEDPPKKFLKEIKKVADKYSPDKLLQLKINRIKYQRVNTNNCGFFAMKFLKDRYGGKNFKDATGFSIINKALKGEKEIEAFKKRVIEFGKI